MKDELFRALCSTEELEFRRWARENDTAEWRAKAELLHPVVRSEWAVMDQEKAAAEKASKGIEFGALSPEGVYTKVRVLTHAQIGACPHTIMVPEHYRDDGTCRCDDPEHQAMMIAEWGYAPEDFGRPL